MFHFKEPNSLHNSPGSSRSCDTAADGAESSSTSKSTTGREMSALTLSAVKRAKSAYGERPPLRDMTLFSVSFEQSYIAC